MKFSLTIIALTLSSVLAVDKKAAFMKAIKESTMQEQGAPSNNIRGAAHGERGLQQDRICLPNFEFTVDRGCTVEGITQFAVVLSRALERRGCPHDFVTELKLVLHTESEEEVFAFFHDKCSDFWATQETQNLNDIGDGTDVFLKAFFDGGTYWNDARQTTNNDDEIVNVLSEDPGRKIDAVNNKEAKFGVIGLPDQLSNFDNCAARAGMCCWVQDRQAGDNNGNCEEPYDENCDNANPADNTDVCLVALNRSPESNRVNNGVTLFPGNTEGATHCHGFAWSDDAIDPNNIFKGNNLFYISMHDHLYQRGYVKNIPGAPMCGCVEQMPVVSRADCTETSVVQDVTFSFSPELTVTIEADYQVAFTSCRAPDARNNDLEAFYTTRLVNQGQADQREFAILKETLVGIGNCQTSIEAAVDRLRD